MCVIFNSLQIYGLSRDDFFLLCIFLFCPIILFPSFSSHFIDVHLNDAKLLTEICQLKHCML